MPRTKVKRKTTKKEQENEEEHLDFLLECIRKKKAEILNKCEEEKNQTLDLYKAFMRDQRTSIPHKYINMTIGEIANLDSLESTASVTCMSKTELLNITKTSRKEKKNIKRSASFVDDEGYLTAESVNSGGRNSRAQTKSARPVRMSRSLSRSNTTSVQSTYKTPANKKTPPNSYGVVTPKCKPNTPQILLRRPKDGEVALSMQGSPLYTASVVSEKMANINIPLLDGRLLTLQPQRGLRISQIPQFDPETLRQLEALRENLSKVCAASGSGQKDY